MVNLAMVGDWGTPSLQWRRVSSAINTTAGIDAVILLGDNFYESGVSDEFSDEWFLFLHYLRGDRVYLPVLGNHDYGRDPDAQLRFGSGGWHFPSRYYSKSICDRLVLLVMLDTVSLCPGTSTRLLGVPRHKLAPAEPQWRWLEDTLKAGRVSHRWVIVCGHYPVFSNGAHGDTEELVHRLEPLLHRWRVHLYVSGHDHSFHDISRGGVRYIVSGTGSRASPGGFVHLEIGADSIQGTFIDETKRPLHTFRCL